LVLKRAEAVSNLGLSIEVTEMKSVGTIEATASDLGLLTVLWSKRDLREAIESFGHPTTRSHYARVVSDFRQKQALASSATGRSDVDTGAGSTEDMTPEPEREHITIMILTAVDELIAATIKGLST
jgi:hypothetical protein